MTELERLRALPHLYPEWEALLDLAEHAAARPTAVKVNRTAVRLERGELVTSERELAERWGWSRKHVQQFLRALVERGELLRTDLDSKKQGRGTKLTLVNYTTYPLRGTKGNQERSQAKSAPDRELACSPHHERNQRPPHTPHVVHPSLTKERSRPLGGAGGGVASARDVDKRGKPTEQLDLSGAVNPEHLHYAEQLAARLNQAQLGSGYVDRDTYRPVQPWHRGTLAAALAIKNAQVPLLYALEYVGLEGQRFKPTARAAQIASLAYLERGLIAAYRELVAKQRARTGPPPPVIERTRIREPLAVGDLLAGVLAQVREVRA